MNIDIIDIDTIDATQCRIDGFVFDKSDVAVSAYGSQHAQVVAGDQTFIASHGSAVDGRRPIGQTALLHAINSLLSPAADVTFTQTGSGAVARTILSKGQDSLSLYDFIPTGWKSSVEAGTNTNELSVYLQRAFDEACDSGRPLRDSHGVFLLEDSLVVSASGFDFSGAGMFRTTFKSVNAALTDPLIYTDPAVARLYGFNARGFSIIQPNGAINAALRINNPNDRCVVDQVMVTCASGQRSAGVGIHVLRTSGEALVDGYFTTIRNCIVKKQDADGILYEGQSPGNANLHWCDQTTVTDCLGNGIRAKNTTSVRVRTGHIEICGTGIYGDNAADLHVDGGTYFERNASYDINHISGDAPKFIGNRHASSAFSGGAGRAIRIAAGEFPQIQGNTFYEGFSSFDVEVGASVNSAVILDNITKLRDGSGGWSSSGPRVSDSGTGTIIANPQVTTGGTRRYLFDKGAFYAKTFTLLDPVIDLASGSGTAPKITAFSANPNGGAGTAGPAGSIGLRVGATVAGYLKQSATDTDWRQISTFLTASATFNPGSIAAGASEATTVALTGAALGDFASASFSISLGGLILSAEVSAADTVRAVFSNPTAAPIDIGSGTLRVRASKG